MNWKTKFSEKVGCQFAVYQILPNGKLSQDDYREKASNIDFACLYFDQENQLFAYYQDYALAGSPLCKKLWKEYTYEENTGILMRYDGFALKKDWSYLQILKIRESDSQTYLYTVQRLGNQPREDDGAEPSLAWWYISACLIQT